MKKSIVALFGLSMSAFAQGVNPSPVEGPVEGPVVMPVLTNAPLANIFVPVGFDNNDTVEVVLHGHFKDSCNKIGPALGSVDEDLKEVTVGLRALKYQGNACIKMEVPFVQTVKLGQLPAGSYQVSTGTEGVVASKALEVSEATSTTADDSLYAPVDAVDFAPVKGKPNAYVLSVSGIFPKSDSGCMKLKEVKILPYGEVLVVLPVATFETDLSRCDSKISRKTSPFDRKFSSSQEIALELKRDLLIHVRVLNGQSLNKVIELEN